MQLLALDLTAGALDLGVRSGSARRAAAAIALIARVDQQLLVADEQDERRAAAGQVVERDGANCADGGHPPILAPGADAAGSAVSSGVVPHAIY